MYSYVAAPKFYVPDERLSSTEYTVLFTKFVYVYFSIFKNFLFSSLQIVSSLHHNGIYEGKQMRLNELLWWIYTVDVNQRMKGKLTMHSRTEVLSFCNKRIQIFFLFRFQFSERFFFWGVLRDIIVAIDITPCARQEQVLTYTCFLLYSAFSEEGPHHPPHPQATVFPSPFGSGGGTHTLACWRGGGEGSNSDEWTDAVVLHLRVHVLAMATISKRSETKLR